MICYFFYLIFLLVFIFAGLGGLGLVSGGWYGSIFRPEFFVLCIL